jgi:hypothetical protein
LTSVRQVQLVPAHGTPLVSRQLTPLQQGVLAEQAWP